MFVFLSIDRQSIIMTGCKVVTILDIVIKEKG